MFHPAVHIPATSFRIPRRWMNVIWLEDVIAGAAFLVFVACMALLCVGLS